MQTFLDMKLKSPDLKLMVAGGGAKVDPSTFSTIAASPTLRIQLTNNLINFLNQNTLDGFDLGLMFL